MTTKDHELDKPCKTDETLDKATKTTEPCSSEEFHTEPTKMPFGAFQFSKKQLLSELLETKKPVTPEDLVLSNLKTKLIVMLLLSNDETHS